MFGLMRFQSLLLIVLIAAGHDSVHAAAPDHDAGPTPEHTAGRCLAYLIERSRLQTERAGQLEPMLARSSALDSALNVLAVPAPRPDRARETDAEAHALAQQVADLTRVLDGRSTEAGQDLPSKALREEITELQTSLARHRLLARAHAAAGRDRVALRDQLHLEKQDLSERIDAVAQPFEQHLDWLRGRVNRHSGPFEQAMRRYARLAEVGGITAQAVRVHATISEGRLSFSWTDARGSIIASAQLRMRVRPDTQTDPPVVHGRYPVLIQNQQETQISAGYFLIDFRVGVDGLAGETRVLDCATELLDIDGLGRLVPRLGDQGLN